MTPRRLLSDVVYEHLREQISRGGLPIGNRLSVANISQQLDVSRTPVKQAIAKLCDDGFLRMAGNRQALVVSAPPKGSSGADEASGEVVKFEYVNQTDRIHAEIYKRILNGGFQPGQTVHELPLAKELSAHGATVSRALEWLSRDGLLERLPRRGWRLAKLSLRDLEALYRIRMQLEPACLESGAEVFESFLDEAEDQHRWLVAESSDASLYDHQETDFSSTSG